MTTYQFYFVNNQIIFVVEKIDTYPQVKDSLGQFTGFNYKKLEFGFEGHYYFDKSKLFETKKTGDEWFVEEKKSNKENEFLDRSKLLLQELKKAKKRNE